MDQRPPSSGKRKLEKGISEEEPESKRPKSAHARHLEFSSKPGTSLANPQGDSKSSRKRPREDAELDAPDDPARKRFQSSENQYLSQLIYSKQQLEQDQKELDELDGRSDFSGDAQNIYNKLMPILEKFKKEAYYVREKVIEKGSDSIPENFIRSWESAYRAYRKLKEINPQSGSTSEYWDFYLNECIHRTKQLQNSVVPLAEFALARAKKDDQTDNIHTMLRQFIERIKKSEDSTQKQQRLQLYQECLQNDEQSFAKLQTSLQSMQKAHSRGDVVHIRPLLTKLSDYKRNIMAIGSLIESDCPQSHAEAASKDVESLKSNYQEAVKNYEKLKEKDKTLSRREQISNALTKISLMVDIVRKTHQHYSDLAKSAIRAQAKGKERAQTASPVREDTVIKDSPSSDQEERNRKVAEELQRQEYERTFDSEAEEGHLSTKDEEYDLPGSEDDNRQHQSDLEAKSESDEPVIKRDYPKLTDDQKKLLTLYKEIEITRMKLSAHLREPYLSPKEIGKIYEKLVCTTRPRGYIIIIHNQYRSVFGDNSELVNLKSIYKDHDLSDENKCQDENIVNDVFKNIIKHQKYLFEKLQEKLADHPGCTGYKRFEIFVRQMKLEQEREKHFQECDIKAIKAEIRAKKLARTIFKGSTIGYDHSTLAVAYMSNKEIIVAINEGSSDWQKLIRGKIGRNEKLIEVEKGKEGKRHAEQVLLDYAKDHNLTIEGFGVSRKCCPNCWEMTLKSKEIIKPEAVSQEQPSQEQLEQDLQRIQHKIDATYSNDEDDPYNIVEEAVSRDEMDQDWSKGDFKFKIQKSTQKAIYDLLEEKYEISNIDVNSIFSTIKTFKGEDNLYITNSIAYLVRYLKDKGIKDITEVGINDSWNRKASYKGKLTPTIPRAKDTIIPCWGTLYIFQEEKTGNVFVYNTLRDFATDKKVGNYQYICNSLYKGKGIEGWKLVEKINKQRVFPDWLTEYDEFQIQESIQREIRNLLENKYKDSNINTDSILSTIKILKVGNDLYMTNNSTSLERHFKSKGINDISYGNIQYSWEKGSTSKGKLTPTIPKAEDTITVCWEPLYVFQEEMTGNVFVYNSLGDFAKEQNQNEGTVRDKLYNKRDISGWKLIYKKDRQKE